MARRAAIAPEGWGTIGVVVAVFGTVAVVGALAGHPAAVAPLVVALAFALWFFRDPDRRADAGPTAVVSPADGRILDVTPGQEQQYLGAPATRISIFMSPLDVHVNRSPVDGVIETVRHTPGRFRAAFADKASDDNERNAVIVRAGARRFLMIQIAGFLARRIVFHPDAGRSVTRGERVGMIMFGSRVDLWVPPDVRPTVKPGDRVQAGVTVVAEVPS